MLTYEQAQQVLNQTFKQFEYQTDSVSFGKVEYWVTLEEIESIVRQYGKLRGDCDDFATICVGELRKLGYPARFVFCRVGGEYHLVAECDGWILDNRYDRVSSKEDLEREGYSWISISGTKPGDHWRKILPPQPL